MLRDTLCALTLALALLRAAAATVADADYIRLMNLGKAWLENRDSAKAIESFTAAVEAEPGSTAALRNLARAHLLTRQPASAEVALANLAQSAAIERDSAATAYLSGLAYVRLARLDAAVAPFQEAVRLDPLTAALRFQLACACQTSARHDEAMEQLRETVRLDPLHASAHYRLAGYARGRGDQGGFDRHMAEFQRLRRLFSDETRSVDALEQCRYILAELAEGVSGTGPTAGPPLDVRFVEVAAVPLAAEIAAMTVIDVDELGRCTIVLCHADGRVSFLRPGESGALEVAPAEPDLPPGARPASCAAGNFHDVVPEGAKYDAAVHAQNDLLLIGEGGGRLLRRNGPSRFEDVTTAAGFAQLSGRRARWVDCDHDGDLDLLVARASGLELWQNNGNATFEDATTTVGLAGGRACVDLAAADLDADVAIDIVSAHGGEGTRVFRNRRAGQFAPMPEPPGPWPAARRVLLDDFDSDAYADAVLMDGARTTVLSERGSVQRVLDLSSLDCAAAVAIDFDNDGLLDLAVLGRAAAAPQRGAVRLWRNLGAAGWTDVSDACGLPVIDLPPLLDGLAADLDGDGDSDLLLLETGGRIRQLRNDGGHVNGQLHVRLLTLKTNPSALGTRVEIRSGDFAAARTVSGLPIEIGLRGRSKLDAVRTLWTNGVVDNQVGIAASSGPITIREKNVAAGSCPFLYVWDGGRFRFVTDILGNSPLGLSLSRGRVLPADPDEIVFVGDEHSCRPRRGALRLELTGEFREVLYLDQAALLVADHPAGSEVHTTDKLMPPPFPRSELWLLRPLTPLRSAAGDDGIDRTRALAGIDSVFAPTATGQPPPYRGQCAPLALTLDFGAIDATRPLVLALTGWLQYGDASTNIAMSQNASLPVIPPTLEAEGPDGSWTTLDVVVGMPAGKTKTILCDLAGRLPAGGVRRIRLTTTFEISWDRIALCERVSDGDMSVRELKPTEATLRFRGFSDIRARGPGHPTTPDYDVLFARPPWRTTPEGWCTAYGDVLPLVAARDDALTIINAGDAVSLAFDAASLPAPAAGHTRTFFFSSVGWDKDGDHNVIDGDTVEPLPVTPPDPAAHLDSTTRWVERHKFSEEEEEE